MIADDALDEMAGLPGMRLAMKRLSKWLEKATEEGRAALNSLRVSTVQKNDLLESMQKATDEFVTRDSLKIVFVVTGVAKGMHLLLSEEVYLIGCEAIRNACLHSEADRVDVELIYTKDFLLRVSDNGKGIPAQFVDRGKQGHFGLRGMRERAARIGGEFRLITLRIPGAKIFDTR
jgi:signal transduction histidine kinase